jgi:hypothetical protein
MVEETSVLVEPSFTPSEKEATSHMTFEASERNSYIGFRIIHMILHVNPLICSWKDFYSTHFHFHPYMDFIFVNA